MATKLYVALDFPNGEQALELFKKLKHLPLGFKVGLELFTAEGGIFVKKLVGQGADVFLDLKFHDIPATVAGAVASAAHMGVSFVNVHIVGGEEMVCRAVAAAKAKVRLLGVTALTSVDAPALHAVGIDQDPATWAVELAKKGQAWGLDGVVCSPGEISAIAAACGANFITMVPGIRWAGAAVEDQKRVATPQAAKNFGAHFIVVGRPVTQASDPVAAAEKTLAEIS